MRGQSVLIANRGEIAIRIARTAQELGLRVVVIAAEDDLDAPHTRWGDAVAVLSGLGPQAYLDIEQVVAAATSHGCTMVHPGYGFLSERADFARAVASAGLDFVGPDASTLEHFGDKARARRLATSVGVAAIAGTSGAVDVAGALEFASTRPPGTRLMVKAVAGGGGRGLRIVEDVAHLSEAVERCRSEAQAAFGLADVFVEEVLERARHVEVQVAADGDGVVVLGDRDCSIQRRHQKLIEFAPAPGLPADVRAAMHEAARAVARAGGLRGLATVEFLVPDDRSAGDPGFRFLEVNPRLQVEHTVTEMVTGLDLVALQFGLTAGRSLAELGADPPPLGQGRAVQLRVCLERYDSTGAPVPTGGVLHAFAVPTGPGVRVDTFGEVGLTTSSRYDSLLAKVVVHTGSAEPGVLEAKARRALAELRTDGVVTNAAALDRVLARPELLAGPLDVGFLGRHPELLSGDHAAESRAMTDARSPVDPLAVLRAGAPVATARATAAEPLAGPVVRATVPGTVVSLPVAIGERVGVGRPVAVVESMKMEHVVTAPGALVVTAWLASVGTTVGEGQPLLAYEPSGDELEDAGVATAVDLDAIRPDLAETRERHLVGLDEARPEAVERRRATGRRTARENLADLLDDGSFVEYAPLVVAAQRRRRSLDDLIRRTPGDGLVGGVGTVNAAAVGADRARVVALTYDYTVLAGTQGLQNHRKKDRLFELAERLRLPVVLFAEGGGGRPGDTDGMGISGLDCLAFSLFGRLSGLVPLVGITTGFCFAGNAALLGTCDVVIATEDANIGMGGPAMIEGGGLGVFHPTEIGPVTTQQRNGVVDVVVPDEAAAVAAARRYLAYFQGPLASWEVADQRLLRSAIPENRLRVYDVREVIRTLADLDSVLELRRGFGAGMVTALARIEGRSVGIVANDPVHLGGAIDAEAADKAARFMQLCDAYDIPLVFLCDTPGFMVGPDAEAQALVRKAARMFVTGGSLTVPFMTIVLRKGYGLGAQAMAGGSFRAPLFTVAWPSGEFGGMGLEGAVKLGYRKELEAVADPAERAETFAEMVARMYEHGKAINAASVFEIDDVIDPVDSRRWIMAMLEATPPQEARTGKKRPCVDTW